MGSQPDDQNADPPRNLANVTPDVSGGTGQTRLLVKAVEDQLVSVKSDVKDIKAYRHTDFVYIISLFGIGFVLLAGMIITTYLKIDEKLSMIIHSTIKTETKLDDLIQRIPPIQTPPPRR